MKDNKTLVIIIIAGLFVCAVASVGGFFGLKALNKDDKNTGETIDRNDESSQDDESNPESSNIAPTQSANTGSSNTKSGADKNPGESINPIDQGKVKASDSFSYKLLDVRKASTKVLEKETQVLLVKLEVENISKWTRNLSIAEVRLSKVEPSSTPDYTNNLNIDFFFPREQMGLDLAGDVSEIKPGEKVVGYYSYTLEDGNLPEKLYFHLINLGNPNAEDEVDLSKTFTTADAFVIR